MLKPLAPNVAFARIANADDFLGCGWIPKRSLVGTGHGDWSILMERPDCECGRVPYPLSQRKMTSDRSMDTSGERSNG
jgi:hypothetical protein